MKTQLVNLAGVYPHSVTGVAQVRVVRVLTLTSGAQ